MSDQLSSSSSVAAAQLPLLANINIKEDVPMEATVVAWIDCYKRRELANAAIADLLNFFLVASGCKGRLTEELIRHYQFTQLIKKMTVDFDEESSEYPLIAASASSKKVKQNLSDFVAHFIEQIRHSYIYNNELMDSLLGFMTQLGDSQVRAFRHTATFIAVKLLTAILSVWVEVEESLVSTRRQLENEQARGGEPNQQRLQLLERSKAEQERNCAELKEHWFFIFNGVFSHRYRDFFPEVRVVCVDELGKWMQMKPDDFVTDTYLKYIGWLLFDKAATVRLECLRALHPLLDEERFALKMELFVTKFRKRLVQMMLDIDDECSCMALKVITALNRTHKDVLTDTDRETIFELCYAANRNLAQAAGAFLNDYITLTHEQQPAAALAADKGKGAKAAAAAAKKKDKKHELAPILLDIGIFFMESEVHKNTTYLVDSLIEVNNVVTDWETYTYLMLSEPENPEKTLDSRQEAVLIDLMISAAIQTSNNHPPHGRGGAKPQKVTQKEKRHHESERDKMTNHFVTSDVFPRIVRKYAADPEKVAKLLELVPCLNIDILKAARNNHALEEFISVIKQVFLQHHSEHVLRQTAKALEVLSPPGARDIADNASHLVSHLIDELANDLYKSINAFIEQPDEQTEFGLDVALRRAAIMSCYQPTTGRELFHKSFDVLKDAVEANVTESIMISAQQVCHHEIFWTLTKAYDVETEQSAIDELKTIRDDYLATVIPLITNFTKPDVSAKCYASVCDLLLFFSFKLRQDHPHLASLEIAELTGGLKTALQTFFENKVLSFDSSPDYINDENVESNEQRMEEVFEHRRYMAAYMRLILTGILPVKDSAVILQFYAKTKCYGDLFKWFVTKFREVNKERCCEQMFNTLVRLYENYLHKTQKVIDYDSQDFYEMKDLCRRFAMLLGIDTSKMTTTTNAFHQLVFRYVFGSTLDVPHRDRIPFLVVVQDFTVKLTKRDKSAIVQFIDSKIADLVEADSDMKAKVQMYRSIVVGFLQGEAGTEFAIPASVAAAGGMAAGKRRRGRPRKAK